MDTSPRANGFTLLELMVALIVVSILLVVGLPSFSATVRQNCTVTTANTLLTVLTAARSEALKRDRTVTVCLSVDGEHCASGSAGSWDQGYLMFLDSDGDHTYAGTAAEPLLKVERPLSTCARITKNGDRPYIRYGGLGRMLDAASFTVAATSGARFERQVVISPTGRPRVERP
ncbi:MAG: GspH/FimT family pseudopilin [Nevskia sp.]|uniref:GspH/FimT family pseudopilin n=1 Tax=Nevskia sp. TaxID=1929292 RepID=UPI004036938F